MHTISIHKHSLRTQEDKNTQIEVKLINLFSSFPWQLYKYKYPTSIPSSSFKLAANTRKYELKSMILFRSSGLKVLNLAIYSHKKVSHI